MKLLPFLIFSLIAFSATAAEITVYEIPYAADEYRSVELSYDVTYGPAITASALRTVTVPSHPELNVDEFVIRDAAISLQGSVFNITIDGKTTACATVQGTKTLATGACELKAVTVDNKISIVIVTQD